MRINFFIFFLSLPLAAVPSLPLWLEPAPDGRFLAGRQAVTAHSVALSPASEMRIAGGRPSIPVPSDPLPGRTNDLRGDRSRWRAGIPHYARLRYPSIYAGIDLVYRVVDSSLEFDFELAPGASPADIVLEFDSECRLDRGDLVAGDARLHAPRVFQDGRGIPGAFRLLGPRRAGFFVGSYDRSRPLLIDPVLAFSSVVADPIQGIATDPAGNVYIAGTTTRRQTESNCQRGQHGYAPCETVYVSKFDSSGTKLLYTTWLGDSRDVAAGIAVDRAGSAYVAASALPVPRVGSNTDGHAWIRKLSPDGSAVLYHRPFGPVTTANSIAIDSAGNAYLAGGSASAAFEPVNALQSTSPVKPIYATSDGGATWRAIATLPAMTVNSLAVDPAKPSILYAATSSGLFRSKDTGQTWTRLLPNANAVTQVVFAGGALYIVYGSDIAKSVDGGDTWQVLTSAVPPPRIAADHRFTALAADPNNPAILWLADVPSGESTIFRSDDSGAHWTTAHSFPAFFIGGSFSGDGILVDPKVPGRVYLCCVAALSETPSAIWRTDDNGATWTRGGSGPTAGSSGIWPPRLDPGGALYAPWYGGLVRSLDAGNSWSAVPLPAGAPVVGYSSGSLAIAGTTFLLVNDNGTLFRSTNSGASWTSTSGPWSPSASILAADASGSTIYVGSPSISIQDGFAAKVDPAGAVLWSTLLAGSRDDEARGIAVDTQGNVFVAGWTNSPDFPGAAHAPVGGRSDAFVTAISGDGKKRGYTTLLGGAWDDQANAIAVMAGMAYVAGRSGEGRGASFVAELGPSGEQTHYKVFGGTDGYWYTDAATAIGVWQTSFMTTGIWVAGTTSASDFPLNQPLQPSSPPGPTSYLMVVLTPSFFTGFSTYLGWSYDLASAVAITPSGSVWIGGNTIFDRVDLEPKPPANPGTPEIRSVYNAASYRLGDLVAPGEIVTLFGTDFDGATVTVGGIDAHVYYAAAGQINFVVPPDVPRTGAAIVVHRGDKASVPRSVAVQDSVPGVFAVVHASDYTPVTAANPARRGEYLSIFCTGLGSKTPDAGYELVYAGPAPGFPGLDQINIRVPDSALTGAQTLSVGVAGVPSNQVRIDVQ